MADPHRTYSKGQPIPRDAATFNAFAEGARFARDNQDSPGAFSRQIRRQGEIIKIRNESGGSLTRGRVLGLGDPIFTPADDLDAFKREVAFRGISPSSSTGKYAILLDPIDDNAMGRAYVAGVPHVRVDITSTAHTCAEVEDANTTSLVSATTGTAQILWREGGTGEQWAIVRFGTPCGPEGGTTPLSCACWDAETRPGSLSWSVEWGYYEPDNVTWHSIGTTSGTMAYTDDITYGGTLEDQCNYDSGLVTAPFYPGWIGGLDFYMANFDVDDSPIDITHITACSSYTVNTLTGSGVQTCERDCCAYIGFLCSGQTFGVEVSSVVISTYLNEHTCNIGTPSGAVCGNQFLYDSDATYECTPSFLYEAEISVALVGSCIPVDTFGGTNNIRGRLTITA